MLANQKPGENEKTRKIGIANGVLRGHSFRAFYIKKSQLRTVSKGPVTKQFRKHSPQVGV